MSINLTRRRRTRVDVPVHPLTGRSCDDRSKNAAWLGNAVPLKLDVARRNTTKDCCRPLSGREF
jgi:aromatic ring-cleaving dioxygenase